MKKSFFLIGLGIVFHCYAVEEYATKGAITEALFIIQNKQVEVQEYIQGLKKALTECLLVPAPSSKNKCAQLERYHCSLKELIYLGSIKELEVQVGLLAQDVEMCLQDKPLPADKLKQAVDRAFLLKDKIELEGQIMALVFALDKQQCRLETHERQHTRRRKIRESHRARERSADRTIKTLRRDLALDRKKLQEVRESIAQINNELYQKSSSTERFYIENLECFVF